MPPLMEQLKALNAEHPFWGERRLWAHLRVVDEIAINTKRVLRLLRCEQLLVKSPLCLNATQTPVRSKPRPNQWWGMDRTKVPVGPVGWVYMVLVLDGYTKKMVCHHVGLCACTAEWLDAVNQAVHRQFFHGIQGQGLSRMSDNGCQPTSVAFMKPCATLGMTQAFTRDTNPMGNADTERVIRTLKEERLWLREWISVAELEQAVTTRIDWYNSSYLHSTLQ